MVYKILHHDADFNNCDDDSDVHTDSQPEPNFQLQQPSTDLDLLQYLRNIHHHLLFSDQCDIQEINDGCKCWIDFFLCDDYPVQPTARQILFAQLHLEGALLHSLELWNGSGGEDAVACRRK